MKLSTKIAALCLIAITSVSYAEVAKKEVFIDTGKGGIELKISVPEIAQGPRDFSGNDGVFKYDYTNKGVNYSERKVAFIAKLGSTGFMEYMITLSRVTSKNSSDEGFTTINSAAYLLKKEGFDIKNANPVNNVFYPLEGAKTETYKICGQPVFDKPKDERKCAVVVSAVTDDHLQSIGMMAVVVEQDIDAYNSNPEKYSKRVDNAFNYISESKAKLK